MSANRQHSCSNESTPYSSMDADTLEQLMDYAFYEETASLDTLSKILEAYKKKKGLETADSTKAWDDFQCHYSGQDETFPAVFENVDNSKQAIDITKNNKHRRIINVKRLGIVAAVFIVISTLFLSTTALGGSFWQYVAQWGRSTFRFSEYAVYEPMNEGLVRWHETLAEHGITALLTPTWIPDGFELVYLDVTELTEQTIFTALFESGEDVLVFQVKALDRMIGSTFERNDDEIYIFHRNGIDHYIMSNMDRIVAVWMNQNYECSFSGDITVEDAKLIINSIYER